MELKKLQIIEEIKHDPNVIMIKKDRLLNTGYNVYYANNPTPSIQSRNDGSFKSRAFYLDPSYDWILGKDNEGITILVPLIKER